MHRTAYCGNDNSHTHDTLAKRCASRADFTHAISNSAHYGTAGCDIIATLD